MSKVTPIRPPSGAGPEPASTSSGSTPVRSEPVEGPAHDTPAASAPKYWAFLSYSHHDKAVAKRLQRQLETYRVPARLVGRETSQGPVPARVAPVFRDRDELHAGADLKASVQDALSRSRWLIVVCTPDAARSPWVNREIIEFKRLRGERHVLALIARGEPFASDMPGREAEECFPPALRRALNEQGVPEGEPLEPIAADMRKHGDGPQRATLKLLAGMIGVGFDDLVRRDMQRRVRVLSAVAGASVVGVLGFALLAVMAVRARNEAQHQRVQAEGLIEFMLGDLRKKLEPVGRLEVLDSVGEKALAYYGAQESGKLDATALGHRSRAMHLIGEIRDLRGNPAEAQKAFEQAAETTAQLLAQAPNDGQRIFDHAQSVFWVGYAAWKRADGRTAEARFREYLEFSQQLLRIDPGNLDWKAEAAFGYVNIGMVQLGSGRPEDALESLERSIDLLNALAKERPTLAFELAQSHGWRAEAFEVLGQYENALREQRRHLAIFTGMPGGTDNKTAQSGQLSSLSLIAKFQIAMGRLVEAEQTARSAIQIGEALVKQDPANLFWRVGVCYARLNLVEALLGQNRLAEARAAQVQAAACVVESTGLGSRGVRDSIVLGSRNLLLSAPLVSAKERVVLASEMSAFLDESSRKLTPDIPDRRKLAEHLAALALGLGDLQSITNAADARASWKRAEFLLNSDAIPLDGWALTLLAHVSLRFGDLEGAGRLAARVERTSYRHPAFADLSNRLRAERGGSSHQAHQGARP